MSTRTCDCNPVPHRRARVCVCVCVCARARVCLRQHSRSNDKKTTSLNTHQQASLAPTLARARRLSLCHAAPCSSRMSWPCCRWCKRACAGRYGCLLQSDSNEPQQQRRGPCSSMSLRCSRDDERLPQELRAPRSDYRRQRGGVRRRRAPPKWQWW
jgi:hypothetical protein